MNKQITIGSRGSDLALWQTNYIADLLRAIYPNIKVNIRIISTKGDRVLDKPLPLIGGKGLFTQELESALRDGEIDLAVHSLKDLPTDDPDGLCIGAIPERGLVNDVLISKNQHTLKSLPANARVGTSSRRRGAQLRKIHPDLHIIDIRGNVPTRIEKTLKANGGYDAIVLAQAGVIRLNLEKHITEVLDLDLMLNAPGQGALAIQCRNDSDSTSLLSPLNHQETQITVTAERSFLNQLGGGCSVPVASYAHIDGNDFILRGRVNAVDGARQVDVAQSIKLGGNKVEQAQMLGKTLAEEAIRQGANDILAEIKA